MKAVTIVSSLIIGLLSTGARALEADPQLPVYTPVLVGSAQIKSVGSDTLGDLMRSWAQEFTRI